MNPTARKRSGLMLLGVGLFAAGFGATFLQDLVPEATAARASASGPYTPLFRTREGSELTMIYIGSSGCAPSNLKGLPEAVEELKVEVRDKAGRNGRGFTAIGVARDWDVDAGLDHLRKFGKFDEVMAGRNWLNSGVRRYVWEEIPGEAATPQVLVVERFVGDPAPAAQGIQYGIKDERIIIRKVGADEILEWVHQGAPLPNMAKVPSVAESGQPDTSAVSIIR